jgi:hypothetical protein
MLVECGGPTTTKHHGMIIVTKEFTLMLQKVKYIMKKRNQKTH